MQGMRTADDDASQLGVLALNTATSTEVVAEGLMNLPLIPLLPTSTDHDLHSICHQPNHPNRRPSREKKRRTVIAPSRTRTLTTSFTLHTTTITNSSLQHETQIHPNVFTNTFLQICILCLEPAVVFPYPSNPKPQQTPEGSVIRPICSTNNDNRRRPPSKLRAFEVLPNGAMPIRASMWGPRHVGIEGVGYDGDTTSETQAPAILPKTREWGLDELARIGGVVEFVRAAPSEGSKV
ncbi:hypothetical protein BDN72DRAFT_850999 [Pluteus cervinus]|uniref:Uncharacterized protein n=1 Tax=Pluteus cervinus TaxID=181527 RepID=A0ACD3A4V7_9AGAR|nr:hypothetical protein BDN72DRAFT_850999 [Pluteus cervinus]